MHYPKLILAIRLEQLEKEQHAATDAEQIADLQNKIEQTTSAIEVLIQANQQ